MLLDVEWKGLSQAAFDDDKDRGEREDWQGLGSRS